MRINGRNPSPATPGSPMRLTPFGVAGEFGPGENTVLCGHLAGLPPRSPGSLTDGLLLLP